jgi:hypothetical protein
MDDGLKDAMKRHARTVLPPRIRLGNWLMEAGFSWLLAGRRPRAVGWWLTRIGRDWILKLCP